MTAYSHTFLAWFFFNAAVAIMLAVDLGIFHKKTHTPSYTEALAWSLVWLGLALLFGVWLTYDQGKEWGILFFTGYALEKSLSLDNVMVFAVIFQALKIPSVYQHKVLFWGVLGALIMRFLMIWSGVILLEKFHFLIYIFGVLLILTGVKFIYFGDTKSDLKETWGWRFLQKFLPIDNTLRGSKFIIKRGGQLFATPLLVALVLIEFSDLVFAVDSIPAIFAITRDPFIVYTANIFAILGLRSLYFLLANALDKLRYLKQGLAVILFFVGLKMIGIIKIDPLYSLIIILSILGTATLLSFFLKEEICRKKS